MDSHHPDPASLCFEKPHTRRLIIASYWIVILLAVPIWWKTTSIERLSLPASRVHAEQDRKVLFPVTVNVQSKDVSRASSLANAVRSLLDADKSTLKRSAIDLQLTTGNDSAPYNVVFADGEEGPAVGGRKLTFDASSASHSLVDRIQDDDSTRLASTLMDLLSPYSTSHQPESQVQRVFTYSPRYRLSFSLLNEDATSGNAALAWDVQKSIQRHISPLLNKLSALHNFTIESQVQFHAPLAFEPRPIQHDGRDAHGLIHEDLTVFVNSAQWTLSSSVTSDPVIHFVLFIPSSKNSPLHILTDQGSIDPSNAFLLPQWGGIVLLNPSGSSSPLSRHRLTQSHLDPIFMTFAAQLSALLGIPGLPPGVKHLARADGTLDAFSDWELDALLRRRTLENAFSSADTLASIVRLVDQIANMPVGQDVKGDVQDALAALNEVHTAAPTDPPRALLASARALTHASRAFFNPGMLALLYFPAEHTYAVYSPLFASLAAPLVGAVLREFAAWRKERKARATHAQAPL
ncbi:phosphatidylinositol-glycan biosynthesis class S protein-domain-containing protein [Epithele typhae]|uniref:phosphatidylinositol-glycan biosynthesis class S protein-domain-containing protein n=1 Tax=Epithele typhae TaxID=378194 RepID=UPI002007C278|nr:phosphatidylinositol-glycan biosynthesis class S protein-domain-containing protein [Epithele typhae]KAH9941817.1 phosphatidylinositol-glycan biosynthesis class S protein-domain-containing protein [Epithele typhae]